MAEMHSGKPLFPGKTNEDQLLRIFKLLGTPTEQSWPGVESYPDWKRSFPIYPPTDLSLKLPMVDALGMDLLHRMLQYEPGIRVNAKEGLTHPYFADIKQVQALQQQLFAKGAGPSGNLTVAQAMNALGLQSQTHTQTTSQ
jgi:negative regulator of PHO system